MATFAIFVLLSMVLCADCGVIVNSDTVRTEAGYVESGVIRHFEKLVRQQAEEIGELKDTVVGLMSWRDDTQTAAKESERNKRFVVDSEMPVAFHAVNNAGEITHVGVDQTIVFPSVLLNSGSAFHVNHGTFQAPVSGLYVFSASIASGHHDNKDEFDAAIVKNGTILARLLGHGDSVLVRNDQGSVTVTVQLAANDEVWVKLTWPADTSLRGNGFTSFTGFLLMAL